MRKELGREGRGEEGGGGEMAQVTNGEGMKNVFSHKNNFLPLYCP